MEKYWGLLKNPCITLFNIVFNDIIQIPIDFCEQEKYIRGPCEIIYNSLPWNRPLSR
jgi:hypothetical protein